MVRHMRPYLIDGFDYEGDLDEDAYRRAVEQVYRRRVLDEGSAMAGLAWDLRVASKRHEASPTEGSAKIVRALYQALCDEMGN